jgi:hypothetical protein
MITPGNGVSIGISDWIDSAVRGRGIRTCNVTDAKRIITIKEDIEVIWHKH